MKTCNADFDLVLLDYLRICSSTFINPFMTRCKLYFCLLSFLFNVFFSHRREASVEYKLGAVGLFSMP